VNLGIVPKSRRMAGPRKKKMAEKKKNREGLIILGAGAIIKVISYAKGLAQREKEDDRKELQRSRECKLKKIEGAGDRLMRDSKVQSHWVGLEEETRQRGKIYF